MQEEIQQNRNKFSYKIYAGVLLLLTLVIIPAQQIQRVLSYNKLFKQYVQSLRRGPTQQISQLQLSRLYPLLSRNPFQGTWQSSIKRSQFLKQQQGKIQIRSIFNQSQDFNNYDLKISIFDGWYRDNSYYDLTINSGSIQVKQRYQSQKVLYQTVTPLISYYHQGNGFKVSNQKSLYINKLKIKVFTAYYQSSTQFKQLRLQILISSQYSINVIGRDIFQYKETFHDVILTVIIVVQLVIQGYGIFQITQGIMAQKQNILRHSKTGFFLLISLDFCQAIALTFIGFLSRKKIVVFLLPILMIWTIFLVIELRFLIKLFHQQFHQNSLIFSAKTYILFSLICMLSYFSNFHSIFFVVISLVSMFPQIYNNYMVGHKLKNTMKQFLLYVLPRYALIPYIRFYKFNVFGFQPNWTICLICIIILLVQTTLILLQINYGPRSILPKFLHPEELKYFLSQTDSQDDACSICLVSLKQKSTQQIELNQLKPPQGEDLTNNIVLTPCKHKFHIQCLAASMKNKFECPNCRSPLPPLQDYD